MLCRPPFFIQAAYATRRHDIDAAVTHTKDMLRYFMLAMLFYAAMMMPRAMALRYCLRFCLRKICLICHIVMMFCRHLLLPPPCLRCR